MTISARYPSAPPPGYRGQLDDEFQKSLLAERLPLDDDKAAWYHAFERTDGSVIEGVWDLRGHEGDYLGETDFAGKRVLELGPASGYLTFWMERQGAEVVSFDIGFDAGVNVISFKGHEMEPERQKVSDYVWEVQQAWWTMHEHYGSKAKLVHGDIYALPDDLGEFDIAVVGAILLHLRDPYLALEQAARRTRSRMIVTDVMAVEEDLAEENVMRIAPLQEHEITNWWALSPGSVKRMLRSFGFDSRPTTLHTQTHYFGHDMSKDAAQMRMFTVVADRTPD